MKTVNLTSSLQILAVVAVASLVFTGCKKELANAGIAAEEIVDLNSPEIFAPVNPAGRFVPNQVLVKFKAGIGEETRKSILARVGGLVKEQILTRAMKRQGEKQAIYLVHTPMAVLEALGFLTGDAIEYAEPNYIYNHFASSDDTYYTNGSLWGMYGDGTSPTNAYGSQAGEAWANGNTGSAEVFVGIIDEGYMYTHSDLAANAGKNPGEIAGNGSDDDGNGYIDDVYGWDFAGGNNSVFDGVADDHGTHVAGTIGAVGGNNAGVAGVCWNVKLLGAKFLGSNGGTTANAIKAVDYFTDLKVDGGVNIVATNNSWGGGGFSQGLYDAIDRANTAGILFIAAAGNSGTDNDNVASYPSGYSNSNIIAVASITSTGALSSFSQYGATTVDIGAPGSSIWSTVPKAVKRKVTSSYSSYSGTSMAAPHVTGAAALYKAANSTASAATIKSAIMNAAVSTTSLSGKCVSGGRLNVSGF